MDTTRLTIQIFWNHARRYPALLWGIGLALPFAVVGPQVAQPVVISQVLSRLAAHSYSGNLWHDFGPLLLALAAIAITGTILSWRIVTWCMWQLQRLVTRDLQNRVLEHLLSQSMDFHNNQFSGSLVSQTHKLTSAFNNLVSVLIFTILPLLLLVLGVSIYLLPIVPWFVVIVDVFVSLFILGAFVAAKRIRPRGQAEARAQNKQTGRLADILGNIAAVKSFAAEKQELQDFKQEGEDVLAKGQLVINTIAKAETYYSGVTTSMGFSAVLAAIFIATSYNVDIALVYVMLAYTLMITYRVWDFKAVMRDISGSFSDASEMINILYTKPDIADVKDPEKLRITKGVIDFKNVSFAHNDAVDNTLFKDFSLHINSGERIGLIGHSGSGKTTFTKLLLRFANLEKGGIGIDGQDISKVLQTDLRSVISYVPQEPILFHRSIRENIAYGTPGASNANITTAATKAHTLEFIEKLPRGFDTLVGERGVKLSGGQRQRIAIARAILKDAPILVLDEATSALDSESERVIQAALGELMKGRTTIVIAHRLSTIQKMDRIVVLEHGKIVEEGTHKELLAKKNLYAQLWKHQSGGFIDE